MNRQKRTRNQKKKKNPGQKMVLYHPPELKNHQVRWSQRLRFLCNTAIPNGVAITQANLMNTILFANTAILGSLAFTACRLKFVEIWAMPAVGGVPQTVTVTFNGAGVGDDITHTDTSMGIEPAHVRAKPRQRSTVALFFGPSATTMFSLVLPANAIVDVGLEFINEWNIGTAATNALVGATAGALYLRGLDGVAIAGTTFPPQGGLIAI